MKATKRPVKKVDKRGIHLFQKEEHKSNKLEKLEQYEQAFRIATQPGNNTLILDQKPCCSKDLPNIDEDANAVQRPVRRTLFPEIVPNRIENVCSITYKEDPNLSNLQGRRIVNLAHVIAESRKLEHHVCAASNPGHLEFEYEKREGLKSYLVFKCTNEDCDHVRRIETDPNVPDEEKKKDLNFSSVWGALSAGKGLSGLEDILGMMDIPVMSERLFRRIHNKVGEHWLNTLTQSMEEAAKLEWEHARETGDMIDDIGLCTVVVDGGWSHRSYGHSYTAKSGVAVIIGHYSKKILFLGIRNKYCSICAVAERRGVDIPDHKCFRNWHGSSPAMEADLIVEGFSVSEKLYNLRYTKFIGDGDSSVHKRLLEYIPYSGSIKKVECTNHLVKRVKKQLHEYASRKGNNRRILTNVKIAYVCKYANKVITSNCNDIEPSEDLLRFDLLQVIPHCFGNHDNCRSEVCTNAAQIDDNNTYDTFSSATKFDLNSIMNLLIRNSSSLIYNMSTNCAEEYMHFVSKFTGGKQVFYGRRDSYNVRCYGAGLHYQYGPEWNYKAWKANQGKSPGKYVKDVTKRRMERLRRLQVSSRRDIRRKVPEITKKVTDVDYGSKCQKPDISVVELYEEICKLITMLRVDVKKRNELEEKTRGQSENNLWMEERKHRLTASHFGEVCKRKLPAGPLVERMLYIRNITTAATDWGKTRESIAISTYEKVNRVTVKPCGLFVYLEPNLGYLAASPDGLVGDDKIIEVKCPYSARHLSPKDAAVKIKNFCSVLEGDKLKLKRNHNYYYQVQGQLFITQRKECDFIIWTPQDIEVETIKIDEDFVERMIPMLRKFYVTELAPEIVDSRKERSMPMRNMPQKRGK